MDNIMKNIVKLRKTHGLSQEEFSEKLGLTRESVRNWENGKSIPRGKNLKAICDVFGVTLEELSEREPFEEENKIRIAIDELKTNLKEDIKNDLKSDLKTDIKEDLRTDLKTDIKEDLKSDLKEDIKNDLRTDIKTDIQKNLRIDLKVDIKKDLRADLKTDIKEEQAKSHKAIKTAIIKKIRNTVLILLICTSVIYVGCSAYKFSVLTQIGEKVSKYENLDNYYCEIKTYNNSFLKEKEEIWYKDEIYKIEKKIYDDIGKITIRIVSLINLKENTQKTNNDGNYKVEFEIPNKEKYENGRYMYNLFPDVIKNDLKNKIDNSFKINLMKTKTIKERNIYRLEINSLVLELNNETYIPTYYINGEENSNNRKYYKIELDCVENKDLNI